MVEPTTPLESLSERFLIKEIAEAEFNVEAVEISEVASAPSQRPDGVPFRKQQPDYGGADEAGSARDKGQHSLCMIRDRSRLGNGQREHA
jgi:hypothetical protein